MTGAGAGVTEVGSLVALLAQVQAAGFTAVRLSGLSCLPLVGRYRAHAEAWGQVELGVYTAAGEWVHLGMASREPEPVLAQE